MEYPFQNPDLPLEERLDDVIGRLNLSEKCSQLRWKSPAIERLGISAYNWWNEALHGVGRNGRATVFPQAIGMAAMWDGAFTEEIASAIADEARAKHHEAARRGSYGHYQGLTFWTPNINIFRDPRWGRGQETWGEDPYLTGELGAAFVRGLQGPDPQRLKTAACAKHFAVHSGPEALRHEFDVHPTPKDFRETYLPAFKRLVDEGVESVMGAYNRVYGEPCCGSKILLQDILREEWGFQGHVVSDCWGIKDFHTTHKVTSNSQESAAMALRNGCDLNCGDVYCDSLEVALAEGLVTEEEVDQALKRLWRARFKLGMFDPAERDPYADTPMSVVCCEKHQKMAFEAAVKSLVLLKNDNQTLPLNGDPKYILLSGPLVSEVDVMLGNYFGMSPKISTVLEGMAKVAPEGIRMDYRAGCLLDRPRPNPADWAGFEAAASDVVLCCMGLTPNIEGEEGDAIQSPHKGDRETIELFEDQLAYLKNIRASIEKKSSSTKVVVLLFGGSAIAIPEIQELADAILQVWYPGEAGGEAIASVLFGEAQPGGRLPVSIPRSTTDLPPYEDYSMAGRTYRYMDEEKILYPFGFGLGYTKFAYQELSCEMGKETCEVSVAVKNTGDCDGDEVVQLYVSPPDNAPGQPRHRLLRFSRRSIPAGKSVRVNWQIPLAVFAFYNDEGKTVLLPGIHSLHVGGCSPFGKLKTLGGADLVHAEVEISP
ncbi:MAG: glycoside hydrolase family 3 C-terminal domain-containing protein [Opitutales bacterium]|nr:glycoside hydrolase family 3 C-terminal domain-containing protein [Opitutales bacterium]MCH8539333.1 glycoside hydrolase family 3 C-terminal domain-containing protein [Opitutales bacterium]